MTVVNIDCILGMRAFLADSSVDAIVTDPPYELGFMGKGWDSTGIANSVAMWAECLRVLKPGGHLLAFSGTRTYHRMVCAIEDAGLEVRDQIMWVYGSGFPKSRNLDGDHKGWGTALKPAHEPICVARKPLIGTVAANVLRHGTGAINIDGCRVEGEARPLVISDRRGGANGTYGDGLGGSCAAGVTAVGRWPANLIHDGSDEVLAAFPDAGGQQGDLTGQSEGRTSRGVFGDMPRAHEHAARVELDKSAARFFYCAKASQADRDEGLAGFTPATTSDGRAVAADNAYQRGKTERANIHPTVKPTALMRYLCRLVTPPGGLVLDPFAGSGSTGKAAHLEGFRFIGFEQSAEYAAIANARIGVQR